MRYIGNYNRMITDSVLNTILTTPGERRPEPVVSDYKNDLAVKWAEAGYTADKIGWSIYTKEHFQEELKMPFFVTHWWFSKLNPGDIFPLHQDLFKDESPDIKRYWMACQDHQPGHIFIYKDKTIEGYKKGDLFLLENPHEWHGACNIGFEPKISLQLVSSQMIDSN